MRKKKGTSKIIKEKKPKKEKNSKKSKEPVKETVKETLPEPVKEIVKETMKEPIPEPVKETVKETLPETIKKDKETIKINKKEKKGKEKQKEENIDELIETDDDIIEEEPDLEESVFSNITNIKYKKYDPMSITNVSHVTINIVPNHLRRTSDIITKYEYTEVISVRAKQIEKGSKIFIDIKNLSNPISIAKRELEEKKCPLSIRRMLTYDSAEIWTANELIIPF